MRRPRWSCIPPRDQRCPGPRRGHPLALPPGAELSFGQAAHAPALSPVSWSAAGPSPGVAAACHRRQSQVRDHRVQPPQRPRAAAPSTRTAPRARRGGRHRRSSPAAQRLAGGPGRRSRAGRARLASPPTGRAGQASRGSTSGAAPRARQPARVHVHAAQVQSVSGPWSSSRCRLARISCRAGPTGPPVRQPGRVTDTRDVISGGQGTGHEQIGHPAEVVQPFGKLTDGLRHILHPASLRVQISAQIQLSRVENESSRGRRHLARVTVALQDHSYPPSGLRARLPRTARVDAVDVVCVLRYLFEIEGERYGSVGSSPCSRGGRSTASALGLQVDDAVVIHNWDRIACA